MKSEWKWIALMLLATLFWGSTFALMKDLLLSFDTFALLSLRFLFATVIFGAYFFAAGRKINADDAKRGAILGVFLFVVYATQTIGLNYTSATASAFITGLFVIFTPILSALVLKKTPSKIVLAATLLAACGLWLLTGAGSSFGFGDAITVLTAIFAALQIIYVAKYSPESDAETLVLAQVATVAFLSLLAMAATEKLPVSFPQNALLSIAFLAVFPTVLAYLIMMRVQRVLDASKTAIVMVTEPVFAALFGFLILGELLAPLQIFGGILILGSMLLAESKIGA